MTWQIETVDGEGEVGEYASLALNRSGRPHISYHDRTHADLRYAYLTPLLLDKQAAPRDGLRDGDTLTYTLTLSNPGLSVRLCDPLPTAVHYVSDRTTGTVTPPAVYSPTVHAIVWQGMVPTDTAPAIHFQVTLAGGEPLSPSLPVVNTAWLTDTAYGGRTSATVIVNAWKAYLSLVLRNK